MVKLEEHLEEIKETQRQVAKTKSEKRRRDLQKHLKWMWKEYYTAKRFLQLGQE